MILVLNKYIKVMPNKLSLKNQSPDNFRTVESLHQNSFWKYLSYIIYGFIIDWGGLIIKIVYPL
jgi:hypothetical protein